MKKIKIIQQNGIFIKLFLTIFFTAFFTLSLSAQTNELNLKKYWHYRYRLVNYFMVVGRGQGKSLPASIRNLYDEGQKMKWADESTQTGYYLGVLATEYALLSRNGQNTDQTLTELFYALMAVRRLDSIANIPYDRPNNTANIDGYMWDDDVPPSFFEDNPQLKDPSGLPTSITHGTGDVWTNLHDPNNPDYPNVPTDAYAVQSTYTNYIISQKEPSVSQDNLYNLVMGLALIKKYVPNNLSFNNTLHNGMTLTFNFNSQAIIDALNIIGYVRDCHQWPGFGSDNNDWMLWNVWGSRLGNGNGDDARFYAKGVAEAGGYFGQSMGNTFSDMHETEWQFNQNQKVLRMNSSLIALPLTLAAIGDSWRNNYFNEDYPLPLPMAGQLPHNTNTTMDGIKYQGDYDGDYLSISYLNSVCCVFGTSSNPSTIFYNSTYGDNHYGWDLFYGAIHRVLHDKSHWESPAIDLCSMQNVLNTAPFSGPYNHSIYDGNGVNIVGDLPGNGWNIDRRFYGNPAHQQYGDAGFKGNFNGLDYMLFHNLYYLLIQPGLDVFTQSCPEPTSGGFFQYFYAHPYLHVNANQSILYANSAIYTDPGWQWPGSAIIVGGPQGVALENITVFPGAELTVGTIEGCGIADPADYLYNSNDYRNMVVNNSVTPQTGTTNKIAETSNLPAYVMSDEFKNDVKEFGISNNPNPFKDNTNIIFSIKEKANVSIIVTDMYGKLLESLVNDKSYEKGNYSINFNSSNFASGVYYCQLKANSTTKNTKLLITK